MSSQGMQEIDRLDALTIRCSDDAGWEHDDFLDKQIPFSAKAKLGDA